MKLLVAISFLEIIFKIKSKANHKMSLSCDPVSHTLEGDDFHPKSDAIALPSHLDLKLGSDNDNELELERTPTDDCQVTPRVVMTLGGDDDDFENVTPPNEMRRESNSRRRRARRNYYRKMSLVDVRARSDPRFQKSTSSQYSSTSTLLADPTDLIVDYLELVPLTSVSSPEINEVDDYCCGMNNNNSFGRAYLQLPWKAKNRRRHSWICG
jgi:hypothetical protein